MLKSEKDALIAKYDHKGSGHFGMAFSDASKDMNFILDALPVTPVTTEMRRRYDPAQADFQMTFWIVAEDANSLLKNVVTIDPPAAVEATTEEVAPEVKAETVADTKPASGA